jgi:glutamyl-tRNA synthetase/glutamyl-Q tRNA(Asp) synthetase
MLFVWGVARATGGRILLRMEDHDRTRCRTEYEEAIMEDIRWLGLYPAADFVFGYTGTHPDPYRQSDNTARYEQALHQLRSQGLLYACDCSRSDIARRNRERPQGGVYFGEEQPYDGHCRDRNLPFGPGHGIRLRLPDEVVRFNDLALGAYEHYPLRQCGDLLLKDRLGNYTYQFAVTADDTAMNIDVVIRGQDLLESTGRQILLARLLGRAQPPVFLHHPLILDEGGYKLSKRIQSESIRGQRQSGAQPAQVLGQAAAACGLISQYRPLEISELAGLFNVA